ncbi:MAG: N-acetyltransferase [Candidatus Woesearchaeota archaeon]
MIKYRLQRATIKDAKKIKWLIDVHASRQLLLPRSLHDIFENLRDFYIVRKNGDVVGCCSLHIVWDDLAEVRSLAIDSKYQAKGIGTALVKKCLADAKKLGIQKVFCLTYVPLFFSKLGFKEVPKSELPQKVWGDCIKCSKFPDCNEVPMMIML